MPEKSDSSRENGDIIIGIGILTAFGGSLILLDLLTTQQAVEEAGSNGGLIGAVGGAVETLSLYIEMLVRSAAVTALSLFVVGFGFIYAGKTIKTNEAIIKNTVTEEQQTVDVPETTIHSVTPLNVNKIDLSNKEFQIIGGGAAFGLLLGMINDASLFSLLLWICLFAGLSWLFVTPSGRENLDYFRNTSDRDE